MWRLRNIQVNSVLGPKRDKTNWMGSLYYLPLPSMISISFYLFKKIAFRTTTRISTNQIFLREKKNI